ncbi:protein of unknown function [Pseudodesulfovibrio profundus]|uniref:Uncharacterized protein n=1 Tax=Pseudodesulfovibrio profundus TaxID=57320 RepID=A0A2C8F836_9BACT|nr:protein of unknown function [Pseudodesulfovibrio profundus]
MMNERNIKQKKDTSHQAGVLVIHTRCGDRCTALLRLTTMPA